MFFDRKLVKQPHSELDKLQVGQCLYKALEREECCIEAAKGEVDNLRWNVWRQNRWNGPWQSKSSYVHTKLELEL